MQITEKEVMRLKQNESLLSVMFVWQIVFGLMFFIIIDLIIGGLYRVTFLIQVLEFEVLWIKIMAVIITISLIYDIYNSIRIYKSKEELIGEYFKEKLEVKK